MTQERIPNVLTIAGTDPSGGAGTSADLKTFAALGAHGCSVVTAVVAQNTQGVAGVEQMSPDFVELQLTNLLDDVRIDALKIGMLGSVVVIERIANILESHPAMASVPKVLDPVMVASSGDRLIDEDAVEALRTRLLPLVDIITPNLPEAAVLLGRKSIPNADGETARELVSLGPAVMLKGGHSSGNESVDVLLTSPEAQPVRLAAERIETRNTHGTGCTLSAAMTALYPRTHSWEEAARGAKSYLTQALSHSERLDVGQPSGHGPVHHFYAWW